MRSKVVGAAKVTFALPITVVAAGIVPTADVYPFPLYVIVELHCAYRVVSLFTYTPVAPAA